MTTNFKKGVGLTAAREGRAQALLADIALAEQKKAESQANLDALYACPEKPLLPEMYT